MYVILRNDGAFVAPVGSRSSYTFDLTRARIFATRESAEREQCPGNEFVSAVSECLNPT